MPPAKPAQSPAQIDWALLELPGATVDVSCQLEYREQHDERPLSDFSEDGLRAALQARGWQVTQAGGGLSIRR